MLSRKVILDSICNIHANVYVIYEFECIRNNQNNS